MRLQLVLLLTSIALSPLSFAKEKKRPPINPNRHIDINYGNAAWNQDPAKIDVATLLIRDGRTGKIVLINLSEIGPDESVFRGRFSVSWGSADSLIPEVFVPDQKAIKTREGKKKLIEQVKNKSIPRKPFILTRGDRGQQVIEVFDTRKQAKAALAVFKEKLKLKRKAQIPEKLAPKEDIAFAKKAEQERLEAERKQKALDQEAERIRIEQLEQKRIAEREAAQKALAKAEQERRKKLARKLSEEAIELYKQGKFAESLQKFEKAVELDPENKSYYYAYGVTLYSNQKYNRAIVILKSTLPEKVNPAERAYYLGMSHFRINDFENAVKHLETAKNAKVEPLSSSSAFYQGLSHYASKNWEPAKASFQWVLDNSKDPKLDEKAEEYIEKIVKIQHFENNKAKQHILTAGLGLQYDSNVLLDSGNSSDATASDNGDFRFTAVGGYQWRPVFNETREFSVKSNLVYMYSLKDESAKADPMLFSMSSPYVWKGKSAAGQAFKHELTPRFDLLYMDPESGETREDILDTWGSDWKTTLIKKDDLFVSHYVSLLYNNSHISSDDEDSDALSIEYKFTRTKFVDKKKTTAFVQDYGIKSYGAKGVNQKYYKVLAAATYLKPLNWKDFTQIAKGELYYSTYPDHDSSRNDTNISLSYNLTKKLSDSLNFVGGLSYQKNSSSVSDKSYSKFIINSMITGSWKF
jgi:tetratricopeptide (TPR) repeat protein